MPGSLSPRDCHVQRCRAAGDRRGASAACASPQLPLPFLATAPNCTNFMADEHDDALGSILPVPPPFYKHFTVGNLARLKELKENAQAGDASAKISESATETSQRILDLPPELRYLIPPSPPADGKWRNFGGNYDVSSTSSFPKTKADNPTAKRPTPLSRRPPALPFGPRRRSLHHTLRMDARPRLLPQEDLQVDTPEFS